MVSLSNINISAVEHTLAEGAIVDNAASMASHKSEVDGLGPPVRLALEVVRT